jgi:hypothetical protein
MGRPGETWVPGVRPREAFFEKMKNRPKVGKQTWSWFGSAVVTEEVTIGMVWHDLALPWFYRTVTIGMTMVTTWSPRKSWAWS